MESPSIEELVKNSAFIFVGTVQALKATTMPMVRASDRTSIVKVDQSVYANPMLARIAGRPITVELNDPQGVQVGQQRVFYTNPSVYGTSLAVRSVGDYPLDEDAGALGERVSAIRQKLTDQNLQERIAQADLIVTGRVSNVEPVEETEPGPVSYDDPQWTKAVVQVESLEKGKLPENTVELLFPASDDLRWFAAPKFKEGQEGIWILKSTPIEELNAEAYTALSGQDFYAKDQVERIRQLVAGTK